MSPLTEQQRHVLHQHEQQLQQLQQLLTSQPLNPVSVPAELFNGKASEQRARLRALSFAPIPCPQGCSIPNHSSQLWEEGGEKL